MPVDFIAEYGPTVFVVLALTGLGSVIWKVYIGIKNQANDKEKARQDDVIKKKKEDEEKAVQIKKEIESRAVELSKETLRTAAEVKREVEDKADRIKAEIAETAKILKEHTDDVAAEIKINFDKMNIELKGEIKSVHDQLMKVLEDLRVKQDMTNGSVKLIREEIAQVNNDVEDLWDIQEDNEKKLAATEDHRALGQETQSVSRRRRRRKAKRKQKQQSISDHSKEDHERKENY